jgi:hypothetical protein
MWTFHGLFQLIDIFQSEGAPAGPDVAKKMIAALAPKSVP